jgi:hypothetical protein
LADTKVTAMTAPVPEWGPSAAAARVRPLAVRRDLDALVRELTEMTRSREVSWYDDHHRWALQPVLDLLHPDDMAKLIRLLAGSAAEQAREPVRYLFAWLAAGLPDDLLPAVCDDWLAVAADGERYVDGDQAVRMARAQLASGAPLSEESIAAIRRTASLPGYGDRGLIDFAATLGRPVLNPGEAWSDAALADAARCGQPWLDLLAQARTASSAAPSARWEKTALALLATVGEQEAAELIRSWLARFGEPRTVILRDYSSDANDLVDEYNANALRGLAWLLALAGEKQVGESVASARSLAGLAEAALRKVPGVGPRNPKIANAAVYALSRLPGEAALAQLARLAARITYRGTLTQLEKALDIRAARLGLTRSQVQELAVSDYGMIEVGRRTETLRDATAELLVRGRAVELRWHTAAGKPVKSAPAAVRRDFPDEVKELESTVTDLGKMLAAQAARLERIFLARRTWNLAWWRECYLDHPLVGTLARRLIWLIGDVPAGYADSELRAVDGAPVASAPGTPITLWHPVGREPAEILAWRDWLERHRITQPFKQAHRETYRLTAAEQSTGRYSNRFAAHILRQHQFHALASQRGWRNQLRLFVDDQYPPAIRDLPEWGLRAEFWIEGLGQDYPADFTEPGAFLHVTTDQVRFYPADSPGNLAHASRGGGYTRQGDGAQDEGPIPLAEVPLLVLSEIWRDADLFVSVTGLGNNPAWQDGGPDDRYREYCYSCAFGELSEIAQTRAGVLRRLLPALAFGAQCTVEGSFLRLTGRLHTYKIHLGSGFVLMSPDDLVLTSVLRCVLLSSGPVPALLPFEGDDVLERILRAAFMLVNDTDITDPAIIRQIRRDPDTPS